MQTSQVYNPETVDTTLDSSVNPIFDEYENNEPMPPNIGDSDLKLLKVISLLVFIKQFIYYI